MKKNETKVFQLPIEVTQSDKIFLEKLAEFNEFLSENEVPMHILFMPTKNITYGWNVGNIASASGKGHKLSVNVDKTIPSNSMSSITFFDVYSPREAFTKLITGSSYDKKDRITAWDDDCYYQLIPSSSRHGGNGFEITVVCEKF